MNRAGRTTIPESDRRERDHTDGCRCVKARSVKVDLQNVKHDVQMKPSDTKRPIDPAVEVVVDVAEPLAGDQLCDAADEDDVLAQERPVLEAHARGRCR